MQLKYYSGTSDKKMHKSISRSVFVTRATKYLKNFALIDNHEFFIFVDSK